MLACITGGYKTTAKVSGNVLVLSMPDAEKPSLWNLDLADALGCIFEIEDSKSVGAYDLVRYEGKTRKVIATYDSRSKAVGALIKTTKALENSRGQIQNGQAPIIVQNKSGGFPILKILFLLALIYGGYVLYKGASQVNIVAQSPAITGSAINQQAPSKAAPKAGVPMSAEDFLNQQ